MTETTQVDKARYSLYSAILFYVVASQLNYKSILFAHAMVFGIIVFGIMNIKGI